LLEALHGYGLVDAHELCSPGEQAYSWIGRTGDGYRVGHALAGRITGCAYLHETREQRLTDHAAVTLTVAVDRAKRLSTSSPVEDEAATLF